MQSGPAFVAHPVLALKIANGHRVNKHKHKKMYKAQQTQHSQQRTVFSIFQLFNLSLCCQSVDRQSSISGTCMSTGVHGDGKFNWTLSSFSFQQHYSIRHRLHHKHRRLHAKVKKGQSPVYLLMGNPSQTYRASLAIWDHTVLPPNDTSECAPP